MVVPELLTFIQGKIAAGSDKESIRTELLTAGWKEEDIVSAFSQLEQPPAPTVVFSASSTGNLSPSSAGNTNTGAENLDPSVYPALSATLIENPSRFYAFPILGGLIKFIILIPVMLNLGIVSIAAGIYITFNCLKIFFTDRYSRRTYEYVMKYMRMSTKYYFFLYGLTNKYPGFSSNIEDAFSVEMAYPESPSRLFAIPFVGMIIRFVLLIPYILFMQIIAYASSIGVFLVGWIPVLFTGRYPESIFELARDTVRLSLATTAYASGLSDTYPSFKISWNHKVKKIVLIVIAIVCLILNIISGINNADFKNISSKGSGTPNEVLLSQKVGFEVLLPTEIPQGLTYGEYEAIGISSFPNVYIDMKGVDNRKIKIIESDVKKDYMPFNKQNAQSVRISKYDASLFENINASDGISQQTTIRWDDDTRRMTIIFKPSSLFTKEEVINFADSFYK